MDKKRLAAVVVAVLVVASAVSYVEFGSWPFGGTTSDCPNNSHSQCFYQQPVVDIILPVIGSSGNSSNPNRFVNLTAGSSTVFEVDVYPTIPLNVSLSFSSYLLNGGVSSGATTGGAPEAVFEPSHLSIPANGRGISLMDITIPGGTGTGTYAAVITATNVSNSSETWGLFFQLRLT